VALASFVITILPGGTGVSGLGGGVAFSRCNFLLDVVGGGLGDSFSCGFFVSDFFGGVILSCLVGGVLCGFVFSNFSLSILALFRLAESRFSAVPRFRGSFSPDS
jgi:hypothetical protein